MNQHQMHDGLTHSDSNLQWDNHILRGKVKEINLDPVGRIIGCYNDTSALNTLVHDVEFVDGEAIENTANMITGNTLTRVDSDGHITYKDGTSCG